jgi:hypothetical protein
MPLPRGASVRAGIERSIHAIDGHVGRLLILADAQAARGRFELAHQTRMLIARRQDELERLRARNSARRT